MYLLYKYLWHTLSLDHSDFIKRPLEVWLKGGEGAMKRICSSIFVSVLALALVVSFTPVAKAAEAGPFYVGVFGGYVMPDDLENGRDISLDESYALGVKAGYIIPATKRWLAVELEYAYLGDQDLDESGASGEFNAMNLMLNAILRYPEGRIHPYVGAGIGWSFAEFKASGGGLSHVDDDDSAFGWQLMAGVNFEITPNWSADLSYRYMQAEYEFGGGSDRTSKNHMAMIGLNYHF